MILMIHTCDAKIHAMHLAHQQTTFSINMQTANFFHAERMAGRGKMRTLLEVLHAYIQYAKMCTRELDYRASYNECTEKNSIQESREAKF